MTNHPNRSKAARAKPIQHTPGPWFQHGASIHFRPGDGSLSYVLARCDRKVGDEEMIANAALISGAPDLLEAAEALIDKIAHVNGIEAERAALIAACVKAHGGANGQD